MSGKELDNLFRNKLEELDKSPSPKAWDKLEAGLAGQQKKTRYPYWRVAAAVLLLISFVGIFLWMNPVGSVSESMRVSEVDHSTKNLGNEGEKGNGGVELLAEASEDTEIEKETQEDNQINDQDANISQVAESVVVTANKPTQANKGFEKLGNPIRNAESLASKQITLAAQEAEKSAENVLKGVDEEILITETNTMKEAIAKNDEPDATSIPNTASTMQETEVKKSTVLVFDIEEFDKKTAVATLDEGAQEEVKQSKFKKILNFVKNVKEGDRGMANIREAKDELFAFDSKKEENDSE